MSAKRARVATAILAAAAATGPVLYPAWLAWRGRRLASPCPPSPATWPGLTVVVAAYLEQAVIAAKVEDLRGNGYPGPLEIVVVADDPGTARAARAAGALVVEPPERRGKASAVNMGVAAATHPIVVLTDANALLEPGSLGALVRWFDDPDVAAVAGEKQVVDDGGGEGMYWLLESWLKRAEHRLGGTIGLVGELAAFRAAEFRPLPTDIIVDDLWLALDTMGSGRTIAYEPSAVAREDASASLREEWERRTRNVAGMLDVVSRRRALLDPRRGVLAAQLWGHRVFRATVGPTAHAVLLVAALRASRRSWIARGFVAAHAVGVVGLVRGQRGGGATRIERLAGQVVWLEAVGIGGTLRYLRGNHPAAWPKAERSAPGGGR